jgi:hypothetical protein
VGADVQVSVYGQGVFPAAVWRAWVPDEEAEPIIERVH